MFVLVKSPAFHFQMFRCISIASITSPQSLLVPGTRAGLPARYNRHVAY